MACRAYPPHRPAGFTMIELIVTMIVVGVLAVTVLPRMDLLRGFDEVGYRDKVKASLEFARKAAVASRRTVRVTVAGSGVSVQMQQQTPEGDGTAAWVDLPLPGSNTSSFTAPSGVTLTPASVVISFDALGKPSAGQAFTVSGDGGSFTLEAETGHVH